MSYSGQEYVEGLGLDAEHELREAINSPAARLVRKQPHFTPAIPPVEVDGKVVEPETAPTSIIGDIVEREAQPQQPFIFNVPKTDLLFHGSIDHAFATNDHAFATNLPEDEIEDEDPPTDAKAPDNTPDLQSIRFEFDPEDLNKALAWTQNADYQETDPFKNEIGELRFNFDGQLIAPYTYDLNAGVIAAYEGELLGLNNHGRMSYLPGYSIPELITLLSSSFDKQTIIALKALVNILFARTCPQESDVTPTQKMAGSLCLGLTCPRYRIDYDKLHQDLNLSKSEILERTDKYIKEVVQCDVTGGFGYGLKRFNEYLFRSLLLHETLAVLALKSSNTQIVDMALHCLSVLLVQSDGSFTNRLLEYVGQEEERHLVPFYLTSRRSVLRRETFRDLLLTSDDADLSHGLKYIIAQEGGPRDTKGGSQDEEELEHRKSDPLLSLLLWGESATNIELVRLIITRVVLSSESDVVAACLRLLQGILLHSAFSANVLHQFIMKSVDKENSTFARVLLDRLVTVWLRSADSQEVAQWTPVVMEFVRFIRLDSLVVGVPLTCLLNNNTSQARIDSLVWKGLMSHFDPSADRLSISVDDLSDLLKLGMYAQNDIDPSCGLFPLYEVLTRYYDTPAMTADQVETLCVLCGCCQTLFMESVECAALPFISIIAQIAQKVVTVICSKGDSINQSGRFKLLESSFRLFSTILSQCNADDDYVILRRSNFEAAICQIFSSCQLSIIDAIDELNMMFLQQLTPEIADRDAVALGLFDYNPILLRGATALPTLDTRRRLSAVAEMSNLLGVIKSNDLDRIFHDRLVAVKESLNAFCARASRYMINFSGRVRYGINTGDKDCFSLTNPLLDSFAAAYASIQTGVLSQTSGDPHCINMLACCYHLSTARHLLSLSTHSITEDEWNVLTSLACGYCYEDSSVETDDKETAEETTIPHSQLISTVLTEVLSGPYVGRVISDLGADYSESLKAVGENCLRRSALDYKFLGLASCWLYEMLETLATCDLKIDWKLMEELQTKVLTGFVCERESAVPVIGKECELMERLRREWTETQVENIKGRILEEMRKAVTEDAICPKVRLAWLWILCNSGISPFVACTWFEESTLNLCDRAFGAAERNICGISREAFNCYGNVREKRDVEPAVRRWMKDRTCQMSLVDFLANYF